MTLLNPNITHTGDFFEIGKFKMIWRISLVLFVLFGTLSLMYIKIDTTVSFLYLATFAISAFSIVYLHRYKKTKPIYWLYSIFTSVLVIAVLHSMPRVLHYEDLLWTVCIILFAFIGLEYRYALIFVSVHAISLAYFFFFELNENIETVVPQSTYELITFGIESTLGFSVITLFIFQFIEYQSYSRNELEKTQAKHKSVLDNMNDALIQDDLNGRIVFWNSKFLKMFGLEEQDMQGLEVTDIISEEYHESMKIKHVRRTTGEIGEEQFEYFGKRKDGSGIWMEISVTPVMENGKIAGTQSVIRDITIRKEQELKLQKANEELIKIEEAERERIAYELHDGLNQMLIAARLHANMPYNEDKQKKILEIIDSAISESRNISKNLVPKDLKEYGLINAINTLAREVSDSCEIHTTFNFDISLENTFLSEHLEFNIYRIIQECMNNTVKHSGGNKVSIELQQSGEELLLSYSNNGKPLPDKIINNENSLIAIRRRINILKGNFVISTNEPGLVTFHFSIPTTFEHLPEMKEQQLH